MKLKNINGITDTTCQCGSWLDHWKKFSGQSVVFCTERTCTNSDLVGGHVKKADGFDDDFYIFPLCNRHNQSSGILEVSDSYALVSARMSQTCGASAANPYSG